MNSKNISQGAEPPDPAFGSQSNLRHRILVAEDDQNIRYLNTETLAGSGYKVDAAADGADAWEILQLNHYDLLVTDDNMPKMSGIELITKLRAARIVLQVILVSGTLPAEQLQRHPWLQIEAMLLKPYTSNELLATVKKVLCATDFISTQAAPLPN